MSAADTRQLRDWKMSEYAYIAKFYKHDGVSSMAALFGIKKTEVYNIYGRMKMNGTLEFYSNLWDDIYSGKEQKEDGICEMDDTGCSV